MFQVHMPRKGWFLYRCDQMGHQNLDACVKVVPLRLKKTSKKITKGGAKKGELKTPVCINILAQCDNIS